METNKELLDELKETIINIYNSTDDDALKARLSFIMSGYIVDYCKCPNCGAKFDPRKEMKHSFKILSEKTLNINT